jgi:hypothetical protein
MVHDRGELGLDSRVGHVLPSIRWSCRCARGIANLDILAQSIEDEKPVPGATLRSSSCAREDFKRLRPWNVGWFGDFMLKKVGPDRRKLDRYLAQDQEF